MQAWRPAAARTLFLAAAARITALHAPGRFDYQPDVCKDYKETGYRPAPSSTPYCLSWALIIEWSGTAASATHASSCTIEATTRADGNLTVRPRRIMP